MDSGIGAVKNQGSPCCCCQPAEFDAVDLPRQLRASCFTDLLQSVSAHNLAMPTHLWTTIHGFIQNGSCFL
jgi:hypothetical protein